MKCTYCDGDGSVVVSHYHSGNYSGWSGSSGYTTKDREICKFCKGTGEQLYIACPDCNGRGHCEIVIPGPVSECYFCKGKGSYIEAGRGRTACHECNGTGKITGSSKHETKICIKCNGNGKVYANDDVQQKEEFRLQQERLREHQEEIKKENLRKERKCLSCEQPLSLLDIFFNRTTHRNPNCSR